MLVRGEVSQATCAWKSLIPKKKKKKNWGTVTRTERDTGRSAIRQQ